MNSFQLRTWHNMILTSLFCCLSCHSEDISHIHFGQGVMAGEISQSTAILQTRFTQQDTLIDGDLVGITGSGFFEVAESTDFTNCKRTGIAHATAANDFIIKARISALLPSTTYYYRARYGLKKQEGIGPIGTFRTLGGEYASEEVSLVVVTGMNYYHHYFGKYKTSEAYSGPDKYLGYPALVPILQDAPTYFIGTGDNIYYDHPSRRGFDSAQKRGDDPHPGRYWGAAVTEVSGMRRKFHEQFSQPRFLDLFARTGTYWMKDDHDYRYNDSDPYAEMPISHQLGIATFQEQLPFPGPKELPYRTHRLSRDLQIWLVEGRDFRSANKAQNDSDKTIWGDAQRSWLKETLLASTATFKVLISPTPMVGPDDAYKTDNHVNHEGFRAEGDEFFSWLTENNFQSKNFFIVCGDRHWQYHAKHPTGIEEFSTGALVDNNARTGRMAGDPKSTDPDGLIEQLYIQGEPDQVTGGYLHIASLPNENSPEVIFRFYDDEGALLYKSVKSTLIDE